MTRGLYRRLWVVKDSRLKRLTAKDIIDFVIRHKDNEELNERLKEVEAQVAQKRF
jgi:ribosomal protein L29